ncbi:DUF2470 domain-containing protein [Actinacidiphila glaucinigra]|uniref:DUF2470 domain-containing protein n=1 Tax=Actinacidiphila glaucinigra TaxID=235986 RepID=UPI00340BF936
MRSKTTVPLAPARPTHGERIRSVLASAHSMTVVTDRERTEVTRLTARALAGHVHLHPLETAFDPEDTPISLEFTDVAPTPVRDRVRARVTVTGWTAAPYRADAPAGQCVQFVHATLETAEGTASVGLAELATAEADPLATAEAGMLTHLVDDHAELVPLLLRLVRPAPVPGARRVLPVAVDRYGITLRVEYGNGHTDARLPFPSRLEGADQAGNQIQALLHSARRASHRGRLFAGW